MKIFSNLGTYNFRSRVSVAIIFTAPWLLELYLLFPELHNFSSTIVVATITYGICNLIIVHCRTLGVKAMKRCFPQILPAQEFLLPSSNYIDPLTKKRYYDFLSSHLPEFKLLADDDNMFNCVSTAVTWLISQTRDSAKFPLIAEENANFGFTYNLLGLKPYSIISSIIGIISNIFLITLTQYKVINFDINVLLGILIIHILFLLIWIFMVTKALVISAGRKYARALLSACDSNILQ